ncbi:MAG: hypothetical protein ACJ72D_17975 [Marmoricola sp.]
MAGALGALLGQRLTPVPGELFSDLNEVPLVYLIPVVVAVSLAQWSPAGVWWIEHEARAALPRAVIAAGVVLATLPVVIVAGGTGATLIAVRNTTLLTGTVLVVRRHSGAAAATASALVPSLIVWTFGWDADSKPHAWAILLAPAGSGAGALLAAAVLTVGLARVPAVDQ